MIPAISNLNLGTRACAIIVGDLPDRQGPGSHTEVPTTPSQMSIIHLTRVVGTLVP